ncbi:MAG: hemolysin III family protein [Polyangia bacterium]
MTPILPHAYSIPGFCQPVSSLSHLVAAAVACFAAIPLLRLGRGCPMRIVALGVYASCVVALLAISGTYHSLDHGGPARAFMQHVDYFAIWLLIAGTFTAVHGIMCSGFWRRGMLTFIWLYAAAGIGLQVCWFQFFSGVPGLVLYLGLGWVGLISIIRLGRQIGFRAVRPLWFAGILFSAGAVLEAIKQPVLIRNWVGPHEIFHLAVIAGVVIHWRFIRRLLLVHAPPLVAAPVVACAAPGNKEITLSVGAPLAAASSSR